MSMERLGTWAARTALPAVPMTSQCDCGACDPGRTRMKSKFTVVRGGRAPLVHAKCRTPRPVLHRSGSDVIMHAKVLDPGEHTDTTEDALTCSPHIHPRHALRTPTRASTQASITSFVSSEPRAVVPTAPGTGGLRAVAPTPRSSTSSPRRISPARAFRPGLMIGLPGPCGRSQRLAPFRRGLVHPSIALRSRCASDESPSIDAGAGAGAGAGASANASASASAGARARAGRSATRGGGQRLKHSTHRRGPASSTVAAWLSPRTGQRPPHVLQVPLRTQTQPASLTRHRVTALPPSTPTASPIKQRHARGGAGSLHPPSPEPVSLLHRLGKKRRRPDIRDSAADSEPGEAVLSPDVAGGHRGVGGSSRTTAAAVAAPAVRVDSSRQSPVRSLFGRPQSVPAKPKHTLLDYFSP